MAKGVRRIRSKLAGGIELFSVSDITFIRGRGDIGTLVSARLRKHYEHIVKDIDRTMLGYELIKQLARVTEDEPGPEYFELLVQSFEALGDSAIDLELVRLWFSIQLLRQSGQAPNLYTDDTGSKLEADQTYSFNFDHMAFTPAPDGKFNADHIKFLRLGFSGNPPKILQKVQGSAELLKACLPLVQAFDQNLPK
jgi:DNA repair protein RecO